MDLSGLSELCRSKGILLIVDATQSFGTLRIDLERDPVDALVFSGYKWTTAGYGIAPLYVRKKHLESRRLPGAGWRTAKQPYALVNDFLDLTTEASGLELGHPPFPGIFALRGALRLIEEVGLGNIEARIQELTDYLHRKMDAAGISIASPRASQDRAGITMVGVSNPAEVANRLKEKKIFTSARGSALRVALHFFNTHEDIDRLAGALVV
jgi:selenocysteine lyase/cysteine desulfurase